MEGGAELLDGVGDAGEAGHGAGDVEVAADDDGVLAAHEHAELLGGHVCFGGLATSLVATSLNVYTCYMRLRRRRAWMRRAGAAPPAGAGCVLGS